MSEALMRRRERRHVALDSLEDPSLLRELSCCDGRWVAGAKGFAVTDPATGQPIARVTMAGVDEVHTAIAAASQAFPGWQALLPEKRAALLRNWAELIRKHRQDLVLIMVLEQGKPLAEALGEIDYAASFSEWYAEEGRRLNTEGVTPHLPDAEMIIRREAIGVAALVTPWSFPSAMLTRKAAAALAAGCTVVAHPSSETPLSALALEELAERAGFPAGVFNVLTGGSIEIVGALCDDTRVGALSFTGSTDVAKLIAGRCAPTMKRLVMELGGYAPLIVFEDADVSRAVDIAMDAKFATSGQDCVAANRIFVHRSIYDALLKKFAERIAELRVGNGLEPDTDIGPLMHLKAVSGVEAQVRDALARGAHCIVGGKPHPEGALFYAPTLLACVGDDALIMREETFGPVAAVSAFDSADEVVRRADNIGYGLIAYVVTENGARQWRLGLVENAKVTGAWFRDALARTVGSHANVGDVRGDGLMAAVELVEDRGDRRFFDPSKKVGASIVAAMLERGLIVRAMPQSDITVLRRPCAWRRKRQSTLSLSQQMPSAMSLDNSGPFPSDMRYQS